MNRLGLLIHRESPTRGAKFRALRNMGSENWWFGDPRTLLYTSQPSIAGSSDSEGETFLAGCLVLPICEFPILLESLPWKSKDYLLNGPSEKTFLF